MSWFWKDKEKSSCEHRSACLQGQSPTDPKWCRKDFSAVHTDCISRYFLFPPLCWRGVDVTCTDVCSIYNVNVAETAICVFFTINEEKQVPEEHNLCSCDFLVIFFSSVYLSSSYVMPEKCLFLLTEHRGSLEWIIQAAAAVRGISLLVTVKQFPIWKQRLKNHC